jgi:hypothetical protein
MRCASLHNGIVKLILKDTYTVSFKIGNKDQITELKGMHEIE